MYRQQIQIHNELESLQNAADRIITDLNNIIMTGNAISIMCYISTTTDVVLSGLSLPVYVQKTNNIYDVRKRLTMRCPIVCRYMKLYYLLCSLKLRSAQCIKPGEWISTVSDKTQCRFLSAFFDVC